MKFINLIKNKLNLNKPIEQEQSYLEELLEARNLEKQSLSTIGSISVANKYRDLDRYATSDNEKYEKTYFPIRDNDWYLVYSYRNVEFTKFDTSSNYKGYVTFKITNKLEIVQGCCTIGYISDFKKASMISDFLSRNDMVVAKIDGSNSIYIGFYKELRKSLVGAESQVFKLTKTSLKDPFSSSVRFENIDGLNNGDLLELEYNENTNTYIAYDHCHDEIGELSRSDSVVVLEKEALYNITAFVINMSFNDNKNRYQCDVEVFYK